MGQPSAKAVLALGPGIRNRARPPGGRRCRMEGWRRVVRHGCRCRARSRARTEDAARKPTARSVMGLRTGRAGKWKIDRMGDRAACRLHPGVAQRRTGGRKGPRPGKRGERSEVPVSERAGSPPDRIGMQIRPGGDGGRKPTHPAFISWACTRLLKATLLYFVPQPPPTRPGASISEEPAFAAGPKWGERMDFTKIL
jgi:hypothetical protein